MEGVNFYYWYYATLAMFQAGGEPWRQWNERLAKVLLEHQVGDEHGSARGSWDPRGLSRGDRRASVLDGSEHSVPGGVIPVRAS